MYPVVLVPQGCHNNIPQTTCKWLKQQKFIVSQLWRPEVKVLVPSESCEGESLPDLASSFR